MENIKRPSYQTISFEKLLNETEEDLKLMNDCIETVLLAKGTNILTEEQKHELLSDAFWFSKTWSSYWTRFKEILDSKTDELVKQNSELVGRNKQLEKENQKIRFTIDNLLVEKTELQNQIALLNARNNMLEEVLNSREANVNDTLNTLERALANQMFNVSEQLKEVMAMINENASKIIVTKQVKAGNYTPAKRVDVKDKDMIDLYDKGETPYKIAKRFNMTQQGVIKRLKKLGVYKGGKENEEE